MDIKKELRRIEKKLYVEKIPLNNIELQRLIDFKRELYELNKKGG